MSTCSAVQQGDEMACGRCGLRWGVADVDKPQCLQHERRSRSRGPVFPPGGFMVTERCQDAEQRATFEVMARAVDLRELLTKYMRHMRAEEGSTGAAWIGSDGRGYFSGVAFSPAEVALLKLCSEEAEGGI